MRDRIRAAGKLPLNVPPPWMIEEIKKREKEMPREGPTLPLPPPPSRRTPTEKKKEDDGRVDYTI